MECRTGEIGELEKIKERNFMEKLVPIEARDARFQKITDKQAETAVVELTSDEAAFLQTKGAAFRMLWGRKIAKGLSVRDKERLELMVSAHKRNLDIET